MNIVLLGPPGAGKGTQSLKCQQRYDLSLIASGDLLREQVRQGTQLGKRIATYLDQGQLVPHEAAMEVVQKQLQSQKIVREFYSMVSQGPCLKQCRSTNYSKKMT